MSVVISRASAVPLHLQIRRSLEHDILTGTLAPGDRLMTEEQYARTFGVSIAPVRQAILDLGCRGARHPSEGAGNVRPRATRRGGDRPPDELHGQPSSPRCPHAGPSLGTGRTSADPRRRCLRDPTSERPPCISNGSPGSPRSPRRSWTRGCPRARSAGYRIRRLRGRSVAVRDPRGGVRCSPGPRAEPDRGGRPTEDEARLSGSARGRRSSASPR